MVAPLRGGAWLTVAGQYVLLAAVFFTLLGELIDLFTRVLCVSTLGCLLDDYTLTPHLRGGKCVLVSRSCTWWLGVVVWFMFRRSLRYQPYACQVRASPLHCPFPGGVCVMCCIVVML